MGSWRRMGAFLGLVAHDGGGDGREYDPDYDAQYDAEYGADFDRSGYDAPRGGGYRGDDAAGRDLGGRGLATAANAAEPMTRGALAVQVYPDERRATESGGAARPLTVKLTGFAEARVIGERYRDGASVILDMTDLSDGDARRVVDFAAGLAFALHGSIDKVTARVFMLLPPHADLSAEERRTMAAGAFRRH